METIVSLCKRRGFIFQSSEIYGGLGSTWDYGPLGVELKRNVKEAWWNTVVRQRGDMVGLDAAILMHPRVWEASGHVAGFADPMVDCRKCKQRFRADHLESLEKCPECGGDLTEARMFNLMFKTFMGPVEDEAAIVYLRPETAQGIFVNFENVRETMRKKLPFGIAQIGKAFRNEITPGNFTFRTREFEQMEIEFFVKPGEDEEWHQRWIQDRLEWYRQYGIQPEKLRLREHACDELAHYAKACTDIEYEFPFGWSELEGIANRTDFDLRQHAEYSGRDLTYFDDQTQERYFPYVIEPSAGADRATLAFLIDAYHEEQVRNEKRVVLRFHKALAPIKAAVMPLKRNEPRIVAIAKELADNLRKCMSAMYDDTGSIGRLYRRQDEIGTVWCLTVDFQSLEDQTVTVRDRDTMEQIRLPIAEVPARLREQLDNAC
ncbi:MAG TPA: glycine--tRNA ligase [Armatimonadota bacterium]|nr:glycine--tRNA ligase [Armatimonadota bacterium]HOM81495.1 glycine--tRNA ligase [Armatimonadota bacterium]HOQ29586.1 glycine--tRNA ligase [Armatimonadota bacterium]HPO73352.1 glycine--tRNA ligase [Armatimonadota bacterium]